MEKVPENQRVVPFDGRLWLALNELAKASAAHAEHLLVHRAVGQVARVWLAGGRLAAGVVRFGQLVAESADMGLDEFEWPLLGGEQLG